MSNYLRARVMKERRMANSEQKQMVDDCVARESRLSDWERGFIESVGRQLDENRGLSVVQSERLDEIWEKAAKKG